MVKKKRRNNRKRPYISKTDSIDVIAKIHNNYKNMNRAMVEEIELSSTHDTLSGSYREEMWIEFFERIIPKKFSIDQGVIIMDSYGKFSREVDICVYDNTYTPYVFRYNNLKFVPIEAVAMVVESKSKDWDDKKLKIWAESINRLKTNQTGLARTINGYCTGLTNNTQSSTRPLKVLVSIRPNPRKSTLLNPKKYFDFIITKSRKKQEETYEQGFVVEVPNEDKSLYWWGEYLNNFEYHKSKYLGSEIEVFEDKGIEDLKSLEIQYMNPSHFKKNNKKITPNRAIKIKNSKEDTIQDCLSFRIDEIEDSNKNQNNGQKAKMRVGLVNTLSDLRIKNNPILTLNFQINQLLMLINNPMLFPHFAYANMFNKKINEIEEKKNKK